MKQETVVVPAGTVCHVGGYPAKLDADAAFSVPAWAREGVAGANAGIGADTSIELGPSLGTKILMALGLGCEFPVLSLDIKFDGDFPVATVKMYLSAAQANRLHGVIREQKFRLVPEAAAQDQALMTSSDTSPASAAP